MSKITIWCIKLSMLYFVLGILLGVSLPFSEEGDANVYNSLVFAHVHLNLLGWMTMMIYGVGYHILPRFAGKHLRGGRLIDVQFYLANAGLLGMVVFNYMKAKGVMAAAGMLFMASAAAASLSGILFAGIMFATLKEK
ncbi:MAG: cbb3-type cytochrome c oxidase subunit I [Deltaproteobacteria bacterium]|nr:cbb3-type cytochrome c oxidase subunit I [Deltaproteobacteria bacterium]